MSIPTPAPLVKTIEEFRREVNDKLHVARHCDLKTAASHQQCEDFLVECAEALLLQRAQEIAALEAVCEQRDLKIEQLKAALTTQAQEIAQVQAAADEAYARGYGDGLDECEGDPRVEQIEAGFKAIQEATNGEYSREDHVVLRALQAGREFAVRLARREIHIQQLIKEAAEAARVFSAPRPERMFPIQHGPDIPWSVIAPFDKQCRENHGGQSLEHIANRGGLDPLEAIDVLTCQRRACKLPLQDAILMLQRIVQERAAPVPASAALRAVIETAVDSLFVNGQGERADRLVLTRDSVQPRDIGGWCRAAIVDRLAAALRGIEAAPNGADRT